MPEAFIRLLALLACSVECSRPTVLPSSIPDPLAYYPLDDGSGFNLRDTVSGSNTGKVIYVEDQQSTTYTKPNWKDDERFGTSIQCGKKDGTNEQKDTLEIADVDYGRSGAWALSVWFRHDVQDFANKEREQFIGHGDARQSNGSPNHFHVQMETSYTFRTGVDGAFVDTDPLMEAHDTNWHQYTFTMRPGGGQAFDVYIDGTLKAQGTTMHASSPFNPIGPFRLCGREKSDGWDPERYFLGRVAHFGVWDSAFTKEQVEALSAAYNTAYPPITVDAATLPGGVTPMQTVQSSLSLKQAIGLTAAFVVGLLPGLISYLRAKKPADVRERVRMRGRRAMLTVGWLLTVLSLTPVLMFVFGQTMFLDVLPLFYFILMLPAGMVCFMLAAIPADLSSGAMVPAFFIAVYTLVALASGGVAYFAGGGTLAMVAYIWLALSIVGVVASSTACCIPKSGTQSERKLLRLWLTVRVYFILFGVSFWLLLIDSPFVNMNIRFNIAYIILGTEFVVLGAVTNPRCRSTSSIMIATLGLGGDQEAKSAARIVFADLGRPLTSPGEAEMAVGA